MDLLKRFIGRFVRPHAFAYFLGFLFLLATSRLTVAVPQFVEIAVDAMEPAQGAPDIHRALLYAWAIIAAGIATMVVRALSRVLFFNPGRYIEYDLKGELFAHLTKLPVAFYDTIGPGDVVSRGTNDASSVRSFVGFALVQFLSVVLMAGMAIVQMLELSPRLTLWVIAALSLAGVVLIRAIRDLFDLVRDMQEALATMSAASLEIYGGAPVLQSLNAVPLARERFQDENNLLLRIGERVAFVTTWLLPVVNVVGNLCLVLLLFVGGRMVVQGSLSLGGLASFAVLIRILTTSLNMLGWGINALQRGWISLRRIYEVMDAPVDAPGDGHDPVPSPPSEFDRGHTIQVRDLSFSYPNQAPGELPALESLSFDAAPGDTIGIFGTTGAGKSTLLNLLARVHEPPVGTVFIDGVDVRTLDLPAYHRAIAYVPQEAWLFSQTLRENVALADNEETRDDARVEDAVAGAALTDDLAALPEGLETRVGERGVMLSGGQRQRTALARAFYRDFDVLLLDDVLSAVDHATERRLIDEIYARRKGATTFIVSHRVSALKHADTILVLEHGKIVARGTHDELLQDPDGPYWRAWRLQQAREQEAQTQEPPPQESPPQELHSTGGGQ